MAQGMWLSNAKSIFVLVPVVEANLVTDLKFTSGRESNVQEILPSANHF